MITVKRKIQLTRESHGRRRIAPAKKEPKPVEAGSVPRISRLMAIAIRLEGLLISGEVCDVTELARLGHVTQPRMSQILNLTMLAPEIQEELLFLPRVTAGKPTIHEKMLRQITAAVNWEKQREMWQSIKPDHQHD
jgi:hypothetical protein